MSCPSTDDLLAHLDGSGSALRPHIAQCPQCREQLSVLQRGADALRQVGAASSPNFTAQVMARLALEDRPRLARPYLWSSAAGLAAVCAAMLLWLPPSAGVGDEPTILATPAVASAPKARGGTSVTPSARLGFEVFAHSNRGSHPLRAGNRMSRDTGLTFRIFNRSALPQRLAVFAVDAAQQVHWFYPAHDGSTPEPESIRIAASPSVQTLPDGVVLEAPAPGRMVIYAVFSDHPHTVSGIEARVAQRNIMKMADAVVQSLNITIED